MYEPVYVPDKTYFNDEEIANFIAWGRENEQTYGNQKWQVAYAMSNPVNYSDFPPLSADSIASGQWIEVGAQTWAPTVQYERNQLQANDPEEWNRLYFEPYQGSPLPPIPTPSPTPTPDPTPNPTPTPTPTPTPEPDDPPDPPNPFVKPAAVSHRQGRPPAVTKIGPAPSTFTSMR